MTSKPPNLACFTHWQPCLCTDSSLTLPAAIQSLFITILLLPSPPSPPVLLPPLSPLLLLFLLLLPLPTSSSSSSSPSAEPRGVPIVTFSDKLLPQVQSRSVTRRSSRVSRVHLRPSKSLPLSSPLSASPLLSSTHPSHAASQDLPIYVQYPLALPCICPLNSISCATFHILTAFPLLPQPSDPYTGARIVISRVCVFILSWALPNCWSNRIAWPSSSCS